MKTHKTELPSNPAWLPLLLLLAIFALQSCASDNSQMRAPVDVTVSEHESFDPANVRMAAILEFLEYRPSNQQGERNVGPLIQARIKRGQVATGSGAAVSDLFRAALERRDVIVVDEQDVQDALGGRKALNRDIYNLKLGISIGEKLEVDTVIMGVVMRYEERKGSKIAVDKPASVGFSVAIVDVKKKGFVWAGKFEKTQKALFENLLDYKTFFEGGMVWVTADELSSIGVGRTIKIMGFKELVR